VPKDTETIELYVDASADFGGPFSFNVVSQRGGKPVPLSAALGNMDLQSYKWNNLPRKGRIVCEPRDGGDLWPDLRKGRWLLLVLKLKSIPAGGICIQRSLFMDGLGGRMKILPHQGGRDGSGNNVCSSMLPVAVHAHRSISSQSSNQALNITVRIPHLATCTAAAGLTAKYKLSLTDAITESLMLGDVISGYAVYFLNCSTRPAAVGIDVNFQVTLPEMVATPTPVPTPIPTTRSKQLPPGTRVVFHSLGTDGVVIESGVRGEVGEIATQYQHHLSVALNGEYGVVIDFAAKKGRYEIRVETTRDTVFVKPTCVSMVDRDIEDRLQRTAQGIAAPRPQGINRMVTYILAPRFQRMLNMRLLTLRHPGNWKAKGWISVERAAMMVAKAPVDCVVGPWVGWTLDSCPHGDALDITIHKERIRRCGAQGSSGRARDPPPLALPYYYQVNKSRAVSIPAAFGGEECPIRTAAITCSLQASDKNRSSELQCPLHCSLGAWSSWSNCPVSCAREHANGTTNANFHSRQRTVIHGPKFGGVACAATVQHQLCNIAPCPVDCTFSDWLQCSACSIGCSRKQQDPIGQLKNPQTRTEHGVRACTRTVVGPARHGGLACKLGSKSWVEQHLVHEGLPCRKCCGEEECQAVREERHDFQERERLKKKEEKKSAWKTEQIKAWGGKMGESIVVKWVSPYSSCTIPYSSCTIPYSSCTIPHPS
jgi:hypothetical protein